MNGQTVILAGDVQRALAKRLIDAAPRGAIVNVQEAKRSLDQNAKMHAMLSDIARAKPEGRVLPVHKWKALAMDMAGCKPDWERGLDGQSIVCVGYKSSRLTKAQMSDVIEALYAYGAQHGVRWSDETAQQEIAA